MESHELRCTAVLTCDVVHFDAQTHKSIVVGVFDHLHVDQIPGSQSFQVFFSLAYGDGTIDVQVSIVDPENSEIHKFGGPFAWPAGAISYDFAAPIHGIRFNREGLHHVVVKFQDKEIGVRPFEITVLNSGGSVMNWAGQACSRSWATRRSGHWPAAQGKVDVRRVAASTSATPRLTPHDELVRMARQPMKKPWFERWAQQEDDPTQPQ